MTRKFIFAIILMASTLATTELSVLPKAAAVSSGVGTCYSAPNCTDSVIASKVPADYCRGVAGASWSDDYYDRACYNF